MNPLACLDRLAAARQRIRGLEVQHSYAQPGPQRDRLAELIEAAYAELDAAEAEREAAIRAVEEALELRTATAPQETNR